MVLEQLDTHKSKKIKYMNFGIERITVLFADMTVYIKE